MILEKNKTTLKGTILFLLVLFALMSSVHPALATEHTIMKTTGVQITIPPFNSGDTLVITGDALEDGDWTALRGLSAYFALRMQNDETAIPYNAITNSRYLTYLDLSGAVNLQYIGGTSFNSCDALKGVDLSGLAQLKEIGSYAFASCQSLEEVKVDGLLKLEIIGYNAFQHCDALKSFDFSQLKSLTTIHNAAFDQCKALTKVDLSGLSELKSIGSDVFNGCTELRSINLLNTPNLWVIDDSAFNGAPSLEYIVVDRDPPAYLGNYAFDDTNESPIYVPLHLVTAYKTEWSAYEHRIQPLQAALIPVATPPGGTFNVAQRVTLASATPNATIYYTLDGSDPITNPNGTRVLYTGEFTVAMGTTLKAFAQSSITTPSPVMTEVYTQDGGGGGGGTKGTVATPIATPPGGVYDGPQTVELTTTTLGATIYYTLDCSDPATSPTRQRYTGPITIEMGTMLKAYAVKAGMYDSGLLIQCYTQKGYVIMPIATPPGGLYTNAQTVALATETQGATIYYTLDGSDPVKDPNGTRQMYTKALHIPLGTTLKAYATREGLLPSAVLTETYMPKPRTCDDSGGCNGGFDASSLLLLLSLLPLTVIKKVRTQ